MDDKEGGRANATNDVCRDFQNYLVGCGRDVTGFQGNLFTWQRMGLRERLDRVVINVRWRLMFQEAYIFHLPNFKSNHVPLWLRFKKLRGNKNGNRLFKFLASWLTYESFENVVKKI